MLQLDQIYITETDNLKILQGFYFRKLEGFD